jgi:Fe2+ transport system protein FeoA
MSNIKPQCPLVEGSGNDSFVCPLSQVRAGSAVKIKHLKVPPEVKRRLQEMGMREKQKIRLLMRQGSYVCQVCNARLGLSAALADRIIVEAKSSDQALK